MKKIIIGIVALVVIIGAYSYFKNDNSLEVLEKTVKKELSEQKEMGEKIMEEIDMQGLIEKVQNGEITEAEFEAEMKNSLAQSKTFNSEFEKNKALMPSYLEITKFYKDCIEDANSLSSAKKCQASAEVKAKSLGIYDEDGMEDDELTSWTDQDKQKELDELNEGISEMQKTITCFDTTSNMTEALNCMEKANA